jgi:hypothetical protein
LLVGVRSMNIPLLAQQAVALLSPFLPKLLNFGDKVKEGVAREIGGDLWKKAKSIWERIGPRLKQKEAGKEALADLAKAPDNEEARTVLKVQIQKILEQDRNLATELAKLFEAAPSSGDTIQSIGERSVAAKSIHGSTIITGDQAAGPKKRPSKRTRQ